MTQLPELSLLSHDEKDALILALFDTRREADTARNAEQETGLRAELAEVLRGEVVAMNVNNFIVRPKRKLVEAYAKPEAWAELGEEARQELADEVAGLPSERAPEALEAKQFDLLMLNLQLSVLGQAPGFDKLKVRVTEIAAALEEQSAIPAIRDQLELIAEVQTDAWWQDVTVGMLENARKRLRGLVHLIEKRKRKPIYTDFEDDIAEGAEIDFAAFAATDDFETFRRKARHFLRQHESHVTINKLRMNRALTPTDLQELERVLRESGSGTDEHIERAKADAPGLGLFVRSLVGLDRAAAKEAFGEFLKGRQLKSNQIQFVGLIIDELTEQGQMLPERLYEAPFTGINSGGLDSVFADADAERLIEILKEVRQRAVA